MSTSTRRHDTIALGLYTEEEERMPNGVFFNFARRTRKLRYYGDVIQSFDWKSAIIYDGGVKNA